MKRRNFLINSAAALGGCALFSGCSKEIKKEGMVPRRKFKNIDVPILGLGCARFPMEKNNKIDMVELDKMVEYLMDHGVNLFDTAYFYVNFQSETALGEILKKYPRDSYLLSDKTPIFMLKDKQDIRKIFNDQLKKCGVDYFDFYLAQGINEDCYDMYKNTELHKELLELKKEGKIKYLGFSFHGTNEILKEVLAEGKWDFCQLQLNYYNWNVIKAKEQYELIRSAKLPIFAIRSLKVGDLSQLPPKADQKLHSAYPNIAPSEFAARWTVSLDGVKTVMIGMGSMEQVKQNVEYLERFKPMSEEEKEVADKVAKVIQSEGEIECNGCNYCLEVCPKGINVPANIAIYNQFKFSKIDGTIRNGYQTLSQNERAENCTKCGLCSKVCPKKLNIPEVLAKITDEYKIHTEIIKARTKAKV